MTRLTLYSKPGCHLCDDMKAVARRVAKHVPLTIEEIDISTDRELQALYGMEIPVLLVDGVKAAKYRISDDELLRVVGSRNQGC